MAATEAQELTTELGELYHLHQDLLGNKKFLVTVSGGADGSGYDVAPWVQAPQGAIQFDEQQKVALPAAPSADTIVLSMTVPKGYDGVIKRYSCNFVGGGFQDGSGDIVWRLLADNRAIRNFNEILTERGTVEFPRQLDFGIRIYSGQVINFVVNHVANVVLNGDVICSLSGYIYPSKGN